MMSLDDRDIEYDYFASKEEDVYHADTLSKMEMDILKVLNTYLTITKYVIHKPKGTKKELRKNIKRITKIRDAVLRRDGSIKKYLDEEGQYYDLL